MTRLAPAAQRIVGPLVASILLAQGGGYALTFMVVGVMAAATGRSIAETGTTTLLGMLMTISVMRALGPDLIGLVVAARLASGYTAEIGAMKSANQIDALVAFGTDPVRKLAVPRVIAPALSSRTTSPAPAASTARPHIALPSSRRWRPMPA